MTPPNDPEVYLSTSTVAIGRGGEHVIAWRLIHRGLPLCADRPDKATAIACASSHGFHAATLAIWDGDAGAWRPVCPRCLDVAPGIPAGVPDAPHPGPFTPDGCAACDRVLHGPYIVDLGDAHPWPTIADARRAGDRSWFMTTRERSDDALNALPPRYFSGGFFMGEPAAHDDRGVAIYAAFVKVGARHYTREVARDQIQPAIADLHAAIARLSESIRAINARSGL